MRNLRAIRTQLLEMRNEEEQKRVADVADIKQKEDEKWLQKAENNKKEGEKAAKQSDSMVIVRFRYPDDLRESRREASAIRKDLDLGKLVTFTFRTGPNKSEKYLYSTSDPMTLDLIDISDYGGKSATSSKRKTIVEEFIQWRKGYSVLTEWQKWQQDLSVYMGKQRDRYNSLLTLLEIEYPTQAVIAVFRLHDNPDEYTQPVKCGDVIIIWCPMRDGGNMDLQTRTCTTPVVVSNLLSWLERYHCTAQWLFRTDAAATDQGDGQQLDYDTVYRKMFKKTRVF